MSEVRQERTDYGFKYGAADVACGFHDNRRGWVVVLLNTPKQSLQVYVTKTGKVRVASKAGEWMPPKVQRRGRK